MADLDVGNGWWSAGVTARPAVVGDPTPPVGTRFGAVGFPGWPARGPTGASTVYASGPGAR